MQEVTIKKSDLLTALIKNRTEHRERYEEAVEGYKDEVVRLLEDHLVTIRKNPSARIVVNLPAPEDHTSDYTRVIRMTEMSVDETITLLQDEFAAYVMDDWSWKHAWTASNVGYVTAAREKRTVRR